MVDYLLLKSGATLLHQGFEANQLLYEPLHRFANEHFRLEEAIHHCVLLQQCDTAPLSNPCEGPSRL